MNGYNSSPPLIFMRRLSYRVQHNSNLYCQIQLRVLAYPNSYIIFDTYSRDSRTVKRGGGKKGGKTNRARSKEEAGIPGRLKEQLYIPFVKKKLI
jgi:hypothetical protein